MLDIFFWKHRKPKPPPPVAKIPFSEFCGANVVSNSILAKELGIGWNRIPVSWADCQPSPAAYDWRQVDTWMSWTPPPTKILGNVCFVPAWASTGDIKAPPKNVSDWVNFVALALKRYPAITYWQIWNEPTRQAGYWRGTDQQFVDLIHNPAAKVIRMAGKKVVFGGWPSNGGIQRYLNLLNYNGCLAETDVLDVHYYGLNGFSALASLGKPVWQTEIGYTGDPKYLPTQYEAIIGWMRAQKVSDPDRFKVFWFAFRGAGPDEPACLVKGDDVTLTGNGQALKVLAEKYAGGI